MNSKAHSANTKYPKISIITPSFNQGQFLEKTILSVINQNYPNLEYIIVDGGSTDNSVEIIKKYETQITHWLSEKDLGQSDAINKGLKLITGDLFNWLNSDDYYDPGALFKIAEVFLSNPETLVVTARSRHFKNENDTIGFSNGSDVYPNLYKTIGWARIDQPETFFRVSAIHKLGPLDTKLHFLMDRDWWIKYLLLFGTANIVKIPDVLVNFRFHDNSKTVSQQSSFQVENDTWFYALAKLYDAKKYAKIFKDNLEVNENYVPENVPQKDIAFVHSVLNYFLLLRANMFYATNHKNAAQKLLDAIDISLLDEQDRVLWKKLNFRNKYVPTPIIRMLRRN